MKKLFLSFFLLLLLALGAIAFVIFQPVSPPEAYRLHVLKGQGLSSVSRTLQKDGVIFHRYGLLAAAYFLGTEKRLQEGSYHFDQPMSAWQIAHYLNEKKAQLVRVRIVEGNTFAQIQAALNQNADLSGEIQSEKVLLSLLSPDQDYANLEGLLYPDSYYFAFATPKWDVYRFSFQAMQRHLDEVWQNREADLPYKNPYELLIMASIIEKETALHEDRALVAAVFVNRLRKKMLLQTDPTVIYGMGNLYQGRIRKKDLQTDTPYNTYTRAGLPPTPIAAPSLASLQAAAHPARVDYLYFVSRQDGSGKSQFSKTLGEHNAAVRKYILKR